MYMCINQEYKTKSANPKFSTKKQLSAEKEQKTEQEINK